MLNHFFSFSRENFRTNSLNESICNIRHYTFEEYIYIYLCNIAYQVYVIFFLFKKSEIEI